MAKIDNNDHNKKHYCCSGLLCLSWCTANDRETLFKATGNMIASAFFELFLVNRCLEQTLLRHFNKNGKKSLFIHRVITFNFHPSDYYIVGTRIMNDGEREYGGEEEAPPPPVLPTGRKTWD